MPRVVDSAGVPWITVTGMGQIEFVLDRPEVAQLLRCEMEPLRVVVTTHALVSPHRP